MQTRRRSRSRPPPNLPPACSTVSTTSTAGRRSFAPGDRLDRDAAAVVVAAHRAVGVDRDDDLVGEARPSPRRSRCRRPRRRGGAARGSWWCRCTCPAACGPARVPRGPGCCWSRSRALLGCCSWSVRRCANDLRSSPRGSPTRRAGGRAREGRTDPPPFYRTGPTPDRCATSEIRPSTCGFRTTIRIAVHPAAAERLVGLAADLLVQERRLRPPRPARRPPRSGRRPPG